MHKVSIHSDKSGKTKICVDGSDLSERCLGIALEQAGGEFPQITLTLVCDELEAELEGAEVTNKNLPRLL